MCIIIGVLNDLCSKSNWAALPEISVGLTLKPSFILGRQGGPVRIAIQQGVEESKAALSALSKGQADVKRW